MVIVFVGAMGVQHWFAQQPYSLPDPPTMSYVKSALHHPVHLMWGVLFLVLTTCLILMPVSPGLFRPSKQSSVRLAIASFFILRLLLGHFHHWPEPWMGNIVTSTGTLGSIELAGGRPVVLSMPTRIVLSLAMIAIISTVISLGMNWLLQQQNRRWELIWNYFLKPADNRAGVQTILLTTMALLALEMTRVVSDVAYDRHLLPLIPFLVIPLLMCFQESGVTKMPWAAWALLVIFGMFAIACTQEVNSLARARVVAVDRVLARGFKPEQIDAGFEHGFWTQGVEVGHVNDIRVQNPPNAYDKTHGLTPVMRVKFRVESGKTDVTRFSDFGSVDYFSFLPPFHRTIFIDEFTDPWWLDEKRAATRPAEKSLLPPVLLQQYRK